MVRNPCCEEGGVKKGPWTPEEDKLLMEYIQKNNGHGSWRRLPKLAGLNRCGKSCRLRWTNYLRPDIKRGCFSDEEEKLIIQLHSVLGNKWSSIATRLPGRTDNEIKNYWNTHLRKKLLNLGIDPVTHQPRTDNIGLLAAASAGLPGLLAAANNINAINMQSPASQWDQYYNTQIRSSVHADAARLAKLQLLHALLQALPVNMDLMSNLMAMSAALRSKQQQQQQVAHGHLFQAGSSTQLFASGGGIGLNNGLAVAPPCSLSELDLAQFLREIQACNGETIVPNVEEMESVLNGNDMIISPQLGQEHSTNFFVPPLVSTTSPNNDLDGGGADSTKPSDFPGPDQEFNLDEFINPDLGWKELLEKNLCSNDSP